jgi:hypothetical protein
LDRRKYIKEEKFMKPESRRRRELRWVVDNTIAAVGVDWAWPLSRIVLGSTCAEMQSEVAAAIQKMKKFADISREFGKLAEKAEAAAQRAEGEGHPVTARELYFSAANLFASAQWPIEWDEDERLHRLSARKNECRKYIQYADHPIEKVRFL